MFEGFKTGFYDLRLESDATRWATGYDFPALRDGRIVREEIAIQTPHGMKGFVFNTRREIFSDIRVREALSALFDFNWVNRNLSYDLMARTRSYFDGSDLASTGRPAGPLERELLAPFPGAVRESIMAGEWVPHEADGSGRDRVYGAPGRRSARGCRLAHGAGRFCAMPTRTRPSASNSSLFPVSRSVLH